MRKKILSAIIVISIILSFAVIPVHAVSFSSANWTQYERGFYTNGGNFAFDTSTTGGYTTYVKAYANGTTTLTSDRNPIAYKNSDSDSSDAAKYAHIRVYFVAREYSGKTSMQTIGIRMDKDGTGSSRNAFILKGDEGKVYPEYTGANTWLDRKDKVGAWTLASNKEPQESDYHKIDIISDLGAWKVGISYLFIDNNFVGMYYDTGLTSNHFHGVVFRIFKDSTIKQNETYMAAKFDADRIGHREYYDANGYTVTLEDVMQDAGLGDTVTDSSIMFKASNLANYMPGASDCAFYYNDSASERTAINTNVARNGNAAVVTCTNTDATNYETAANMLAGLVPKRSSNGTGFAYTSYHTRAKYIKLSFDQTISNDGMWLEYSTYYSGKVQAMQMWNNDGYIVAAVKGSGTNVTCNGKGNKPLANMTGKNHIDWILEPDEADECVYQHLYINGSFVASGNFGNEYATRIADLLLSTKSASGTVTIENWSLTAYNGTAELSDIANEISAVSGKDTIWLSSQTVSGNGANAGKFNILAKAKTGAEQNTDNTKLFAAIYNGNKLLDVAENPYISGTQIETKYFDKSYDGTEAKLAKLFLWNNSEPISATRYVPVTKDGTIRVLAIGNGFSQDSVKLLSEIAASDGVSILPYNAYRYGKTLKDHYYAWEINTAEYYRVEPYGVSNGTFKSSRELVSMQDWDYIILQGTTHYNEYDEGLWGASVATTTNYWTKLKNGIAEYAPDAKRLVNATWAPINEFAAKVNDGMFASCTPDSRGAYLAALLPHEQAGADIYSTEVREDGGKAYIPTAVAVDYLIRHYCFPEHEGERDSDDKYDNSENTRGVFKDITCHLTDNVGKVLAGLVWYEMITGIPATESSYQRTTLSAFDMANIKEAAHYACQNYTTYDPSLIEPIPTEPVSAEVMKAKNGADAIITVIHDDGSGGTVDYLNGEFAKYNLNGTIAMIGGNINNDTKIANWTETLSESNGRFNLASHSYSHKYLGESDNAESGTLRDGTTYSYAAGHMTKDIANERSRINGIFPNERVLTFIKPGTSFPEGKPQISDAAMDMIEAHYIAMRNTGGGVDTIPPEDVYSVKSLMGRYESDYRDSNYQTAVYWKNYISSAISKKGFLVFLFHEIKGDSEVGNLTTSQSRVSIMLENLGYNVKKGKVWNAKFDEAIQYAQEYGANPVATATAYRDITPFISVGVTDEISRIDTDNVGKFKGLDMFDYPLTVKVAVPFDWTYVKLMQNYNSRVEILKTFTENGRRYVYANVVPDQENAVLMEATANDYVSEITVGGNALDGFDSAKFFYRVELPYGTASAPKVRAIRGTVTQATLSNGEGSAFVTYNNMEYEIHFSVAKKGPSVLLRIDPSLDDSSYTQTKKIVKELKNRGINANITNSACYSTLSGSYENAVYCTESGADTCNFEFNDTYISGKMVDYKQFTASYNANSGRSRLIMTIHPNTKGTTKYDDNLFNTFKDQIDFLTMQGVTFE